MAGFEPGSSGVISNHSANLDTTTTKTLWLLSYLVLAYRYLNEVESPLFSQHYILQTIIRQ